MPDQQPRGRARIGSDASGLTQLELGLDTAHGPQLAPFYAALLGGKVEDGEPVPALAAAPHRPPA